MGIKIVALKPYNMKWSIFLLIITTSITAFSQKVGDRKIIAKVTDTSNLYTKVKLAIIKSGFVVKDDMNPHVLTTNVSVKKILGYTVIKAEIKNDTVIVWGVYSNKNQNLFDIEIAAGKYKSIMYLKNNSGYGWDILYSIAAEIDARNLSYSQ